MEEWVQSARLTNLWSENEKYPANEDKHIRDGKQSLQPTFNSQHRAQTGTKEKAGDRGRACTDHSKKAGLKRNLHTTLVLSVTLLQSPTSTFCKVNH